MYYLRHFVLEREGGREERERKRNRRRGEEREENRKRKGEWRGKEGRERHQKGGCGVHAQKAKSSLEKLSLREPRCSRKIFESRYCKYI